MIRSTTSSDQRKGIRVRTFARRTVPLVTALAETAGRVVRTLPGLAGAGLLVLGFGLAWLPLGFMVGGVFLLLIDRKMP